MESHIESQPAPSARRSLTERQVYLLLIVLGLLVRLPFVGSFDMVTFDGTYYINTARSLMRGSLGGVSFPVGYPFFIGLFVPFMRDGVMAARAVSFVAGVGGLLVLYALARQFVGRKSAVLASVLLALNPLFTRYSMISMSESIYVFWVLLALLLFAKKRYLLFGFAMGLAAITRPEAVPIMAALVVVTIKKPRRVLALLAGFVLLFSANSLILSRAKGRLIILPKIEALQSVATHWTEREAVTEGVSKETTEQLAREQAKTHNRIEDYVLRLPDELAMLHRHVLSAVFVLALAAMVYRHGFLLAALLPFLIFPVFTDRTDARWILPYVPIMILYGVMGAGLFRNRYLKVTAYVLIVATAGLAAWMNREQVLEPGGEAYASTKDAALRFKDQVSPSDKVADRKPYFAFYAGGQYVEIPMAPYEDTMRYLEEEQVKLLSLHVATTHDFRPALAPLLHDPTMINGELRWRQGHVAPSGEVIYERARDTDPLAWQQVTHLPGAVQVPAWSPDGRLIAFRNVDDAGVGGIYTVTATGGALRLISEVDVRDDAIAWSGDGRSIAFAASQMGDLDVYSVDLSSRQVTEIVADAGNDFSPAWSRATDELVFCSDRTGTPEIWIKDLKTGRQSQLTSDGGNTHPAPAPRGKRIAWLDRERHLVILDRDTRRRIRVESLTDIWSTPAWSADGSFITVAARHWGALDVYIIKADGSGILLLTKNANANGMPSWSPTAPRLAIVSEVDGRSSVWVLDGLEDYLDRLLNPVPIQIFEAQAGFE
jgi:hypothetical protein